MKKFNEIIGCLLFLAIGVGISLYTLSPPKTGYKTISAANMTPSLIGFQQFPFTICDSVKEKEKSKEVVIHDTIYRDSIQYKLKPTPYIVVVAPKPKRMDSTKSDTSVLPKEARPDTTLRHVKIPVLVSINDSIVYSDSVKVK